MNRFGGVDLVGEDPGHVIGWDTDGFGVCGYRRKHLLYAGGIGDRAAAEPLAGRHRIGGLQPLRRGVDQVVQRWRCRVGARRGERCGRNGYAET